MSNPDWVNLPSVVLYDLYHLLPLEDRLAAASTCKKWRDAFFIFPNWRHLHLLATNERTEKNQFLARTGRYFCKILNITYFPGNFINAVDILQEWSPCMRFHEFQLVGTEDLDTADKNKSSFQSHIYPVLEDCAVLKTLIFSHVGSLERLAKLTSKHSSCLNILGLGKVASSPDDSQTVNVPVDLTSFALSSLKVLMLDGIWISDGLLQWVSKNLTKLKVLSLAVREETCIGKIQKETWDTFVDNLPDCQIRIAYIRIISPASPDFLIKVRNLTHIRLIYCTRQFHEVCLAGLRQEPSSHRFTMRSIWSMFDESHTPAVQRQAFLISAWRLTSLREMYVGGCLFDDYDLIGMTRLRPALRIHIPKANIRMTSNAEELNYEQILPIDQQLVDINLPIAHREALILSTLASVDCNVVKRGK